MNQNQHVATLASVFKAKEYGYPKKAIDDNWEKLLLNQCTYSVFALTLLSKEY